MSTTVSGWPVLTSNRTTGALPRLRKWVVPGASRHLYLRDGSAGFLLVHLALWWHQRVERLDLGVWDDWGWAVRAVRGQTSGYSNHAGGIAADLNATRHPRGVPTRSTLTDAQIAAVHKRLRLYKGLIIWGGDWPSPGGSGVTDAMHFELGNYSRFDDIEVLARRLTKSPRGKRILAANPGALAVINS
ncbi:MAG: M15 family metallopeptidase [Nocardioides sp.]|uniref:M15 family metallopeptidase n=1 Tax=Nocardioides sp. TaxID=35761 RepID=UPI0039E4C2BE